jgi:hypothetical protein
MLPCAVFCFFFLCSMISGQDSFNIHKAKTSSEQEGWAESLPLQWHPENTLTSVQATIRAGRTFSIYIASYLPPVAAFARVLHSFPAASWNIVPHSGETGSRQRHGCERQTVLHQYGMWWC